jgi:hypothetical protein
LIAAYQQLLELAKREHELARQGDLDALERLDSERRRVVATLPAKPPEAAKPALVDMARLQAATTAVLKEARARLAAELGAVDRRGQTARGYGRTAASDEPRGTITVAA